MENIKMLLICWSLAGLAAWLVVDALRTQTAWVKRQTLEWPWYYKIHRDESPVWYWSNVIITGIAGIGAFIAPLLMAG
jgi:hypothetical protein